MKNFENKTYLTVSEAAAYLKVTPNTMRLWDKNGVLTPEKTNGGHRRYSKAVLDCYKNGSNSRVDYGNLYEHLCNAQYIADELGDAIGNEIMAIREKVGLQLLKIHEEGARAGVWQPAKPTDK